MLAAILGFQAGSIPMFPEQASTFAPRVDALYVFLVALTAFFWFLISGILIYFVIKYRRRSPDEIPHPYAGSHKLEIIWSIIPFIIGMGIFVWGSSIYFTLYRPPGNALEIFVVGKQWMWKLQHPTGQREINELHVPVNRRIKLTMTTEDVIHSFYVPNFRIKTDVIPGRYTTAWFEATTPGRYYLFCTEYCGTNHSGMGGWVEVMSETDYEAWLSGNLNQRSPIEEGEELFTNLGCVTCHRADGAGGRGPALQNLVGSQVDLQGGNQVTADEGYIRESILNPTAKIVRGYPAIMPTFQGQVSEEQILQLVAYIRSLAPAQSNGIQSTEPARSNNPSTGAPTVGGQGAETPDALRSNPLAPTQPRSSGGGSSVARPGGLTSNSSQSRGANQTGTTSPQRANSNSNQR